MSALPPVPPSDMAPLAAVAPAKGGKGKLVGIVLGSLLGIVVMGLCIWFFLLKKDPVVDPPVVTPVVTPSVTPVVTPVVTPSVTLGEYIKGKRFTCLLPQEAVPEQLKGLAIGQQIANQQVIVQFISNNVVQFGTVLNGRAVVIESGTYTSKGLTILLEKDGGTDTAVATKAEPVKGDVLVVTDAKRKEIKLSILKVEPAARLETAVEAALAILGLEGGAPHSKTNSIGSRTQWTYGGGGKDLTKWKGQSLRNVLGVFGNPPDQAKPWGQRGGAWTYNNLNITDARGNPHKSVTFFIQNGAVVDIKLQTLPPR